MDLNMFVSNTQSLARLFSIASGAATVHISSHEAAISEEATENKDLHSRTK